MGITWALTPWVLNLAIRFKVMAVPRDRDVHVQPTPRWGGIAIFLGVVAAVALTVTVRHFTKNVHENGWTWHLAGVLLAGTFIALLGMLDDLKELRALWQA